MRLPRFFNVFGLKVKVKIDKKLSPNIAGQYEPTKELISLNEMHETDKELLHTLCHELAHAMFYRVSISQAISFETNEYICNNFATMLIENFDIKPKIKNNKS